MLSGEYDTVTDTIGSTVITLKNVEEHSYKRRMFTGPDDKNIALVEYMMDMDQIQEFRYICAPDLFRYCDKDMSMLNYVFASCDNFCNPIEYSTKKDDTKVAKVAIVANKYGLTGRIPPNFFRPLTKLKDISGMFKKCSHMTGY